jgi:hypothetical protein
MIELRRCFGEEISTVMSFLDTFWRQGHVLAKHRVLMDWQHREPDGSYNYLCAWRGRELLGVLGYIPSRRFDPELKLNNVIWLALWKVREDISPSGLGIRMLNAVSKVEQNSGLAVNGINHAHSPMYRALRWQVGELRQFFTVNPDRKPTLINNPKGLALPTPVAGDATLKILAQEGLATLAPSFSSGSTAIKRPVYFQSRFLDHPFYNYKLWTIESAGCGPAILATRTAEHLGSRVLRIVDFSGDTAIVPRIGTAILQMLRLQDAEYADFCQYGIPEEFMMQAGFGLADSTIFVPTYFEPFVQRSAKILCAFKLDAPGHVVICRADGDQDRPNLLLQVRP